MTHMINLPADADIKRMELRDVEGAGLEIWAVIDGGDLKLMCVRDTSPQLMIAYERWVQFPDDQWNSFVRNAMQQMVDAWNYHHADVRDLEAPPENQ